MKEEFTIRHFFHYVKKDTERYGSDWYLHPGFWVVFSYRVRRARKLSMKYKLLLLPFDVLIGLFRRIVSDTALPSAMYAGPGLYLPHPNGIIINPMVRFGERVAIFQHVTIGEWHGKAPNIGKGCSIFPGAKIFGDITVGDNCKIGANVVVRNSVPDNTSVSAGEPILRARFIASPQ